MARATAVRPIIGARLEEMLGSSRTPTRSSSSCGARFQPTLGRAVAGDGPTRRRDPPGLLLRHARPGPRQGRRGRRARRGQRKGTTRSSSCGRSSPASCPRRCARTPDFGVEVDAMPGGFVYSGSMKAALGIGDAVKATVRGLSPLRELLHRGPARAVRRERPEGVTFDDLVVLGPIPVLQAADATHGRWAASSWRSCGSTRTAAASSSCRPSARRPNRRGRRAGRRRSSKATAST